MEEKIHLGASCFGGNFRTKCLVDFLQVKFSSWKKIYWGAKILGRKIMASKIWELNLFRIEQTLILD